MDSWVSCTSAGLFSKRRSHEDIKITFKGHLWSEPNANLDASWITCSDFMQFNTNMSLHSYTTWKKQILVGDPIRNTSTTAQSQTLCRPMKLPENNTFFQKGSINLWKGKWLLYLPPVFIKKTESNYISCYMQSLISVTTWAKKRQDMAQTCMVILAYEMYFTKANSYKRLIITYIFL